MRILIFAISFFLLGCFHHKGISMLNSGKKSIELHYSKDSVILGEEIQFFVTYNNNSSSPDTFRDPAKTWEVMLEVTKLSDSSVDRLPFGKMFVKTSQQGIVSQYAEPAEEIVIKPKDKYLFVPDTYKKHLNIFGPGEYRLRVIDRTSDEETLSSNEIKFAVEVTESSVEYLMEIFSDESQSLDNRDFAGKWIKSLYPDFSYEMENLTDDQKKTNAQNIGKIRIWRESHPDDPELLMRIKVINSQAGVIPKE
jgi:hypothetical protein